MPKQKSISQRLATAKALETKKVIALDWANNWHSEQAELIQRLGQAVKDDDYDELCIVTGQLKAVTEKRLTVLPKVITKLTEKT